MSESPIRSGTRFRVHIAHALEDAEWAERLAEELMHAGFDEIVSSNSLPPISGPEIEASFGLHEAEAVVALFTPASLESPSLFFEIGRYEAQRAARDDASSLVIPIVFGPGLVESQLDQIGVRQLVLVDGSIYDSKDFESADWKRAVREVRRALTDARDQRPRQPEAAALEPTEQILGQARIRVVGGVHVGWLLGDDLAVVAAGPELAETEVEISTHFGFTHGVVSRWAQPSGTRFHDMALLRLNPVLELPRPLPVDQPRARTATEFWSPALIRVAWGEIYEEAPDGGFEIFLREGDIDRGPATWAVWDPLAKRYLGVASRSGEGWRVFSLTELRERAGKPAESAAVRPPSSRIHDDRWTVEDRLDYALYGHAIKEFVEHPDTRPPLVIGVQGPWGQGKTSLMRIAQERLDGEHADLVARRNATASVSHGPSEITLKKLRDSLDGDFEIGGTAASEIRSVWFNPWKYQSSEALWAGLAHAILTQLPARLDRREQELFWLKLQLRRIDATAVRRDIHRLILERMVRWLALSILVAVAIALACLVVGASVAVGAVGTVGGAVLTAVGSGFVVSRRALNGKLEGSYLRYVRQPDYESKLGYLHHVEEDVRAALDLLTQEGRPTVIFIDDLDRCSAAKISEVLEAINLFLSGDYPNCVFVLGIDAQVVASAMETVHRQALGEDEGEKDDIKGNLGWRFLDKFIQLGFVMPRLSERQQQAYLASLIGSPDGAVDDGAAARQTDAAERARHDLAAGTIGAEQAARTVGALSEDATLLDSEVRRIAEDVITLGARDFSDSDPEAVASLWRRLGDLSDNPRTIKRAVNLYRFYRFIAWARQASAADLDAADPDLIASWTVIAARWPQVVHWLQVEGRKSPDPEQLLRTKWEEDEPELCAFLSGESELDLGKARDCGLW